MCRKSNDLFSMSVMAALLCAATFAGALPCSAFEPAAGVTDIRGQGDDIQIQVENASIRQILDGLSRKFNLTFVLPADVGRQLTGRYSGNLNRILSRVLDGNNYILEVTEDGMRIVVLGPAGTIASTSTSPTPSASPTASANPTSSGSSTSSASPTTPAGNDQPTPAAVAASEVSPPVTQPAAPTADQVPPLTSYLSVNAPSAGPNAGSP
jgi:hypothetical protein